MTPKQLDAPGVDEIEISVFGPGVGESVAAHLGDGFWIIIDSCKDPDTQNAAALDYLQAIGVNIDTAVRLVVASHWHDDHIRGLSDIFFAARSARFYCSAALQQTEFQALLEAATGNTCSRISSGVDEMRYIFGEIMDRRHKRTPLGAAGPGYAKANTLLFQERDPALIRKTALALSPSDSDLTLAWHRLNIENLGRPGMRVPSQSPNDCAVALQLSAGSQHVLLGSDLEDSPDPTRGWCAATNCFNIEQSSIYKVAHHGSENADSDNIWALALGTQPLCKLTPYGRGRTPRPSPSDIQRILSRSPLSYISAPIKPRNSGRSKLDDRLCRDRLKTRRRVSGKLGHIRSRANVHGGPWSVGLFGAAMPLASIPTN